MGGFEPDFSSLTGLRSSEGLKLSSSEFSVGGSRWSRSKAFFSSVCKKKNVLRTLIDVMRPLCLVESRSQDVAANAGVLSVYLATILYDHLQLVNDIERDNISEDPFCYMQKAEVKYLLFLVGFREIISQSILSEL